MNLLTRLLPTLGILLALTGSVRAQDDTPIVRVGGNELGAEAFKDWLFERFAIDYAESWAREHAALQLAEAEGLAPTDADVDAAWVAERALIISSFHKDDEDSFLTDIVGRGYTEESYAALRKAQLRAEVALMKLAAARRVITDEQVAARFDALYGTDREVTSARALFYNMYIDIEPGMRPDPRALKVEAKARAEAALAAWRAGADYELLQKDSDRIGSKFVSAGHIAHYRKDMLGPEVDHALMILDRPGEISPVIEVWDGYVVISLLGRRTVGLEGEAAAVRAELEAQMPNSAELSMVQAEANERAEIEVLIQ